MASEVSRKKVFGGDTVRYKHDSSTLGCTMHYTVYFPPAATTSKVPVVFYLSGLTCTDENFVQKAGAHRAASRLGLALISPDTSPRGLNVDGEADSYDFGVGAGFYLNATTEKWQNWRMYDYVTKELPALLRQLPNLDIDNAAITGHSMGGHGALTLGLKNPDLYKAISAFAPIVNPIAVPWGQKAFTGYLGNDKEAWKQYDSCELAQAYSGPKRKILIDQGSADEFLQNQLKPENFQEACSGNPAISLDLRIQDGYDHSYFFISTFIDDHLEFLASGLQ